MTKKQEALALWEQLKAIIVVRALAGEPDSSMLARFDELLKQLR